MSNEIVKDDEEDIYNEAEVDKGQFEIKQKTDTTELPMLSINNVNLMVDSVVSQKSIVIRGYSLSSCLKVYDELQKRFEKNKNNKKSKTEINSVAN